MYKTLKTIPDFNQAFTLIFLAPSKQNRDSVTHRLHILLTLLHLQLTTMITSVYLLLVKGMDWLVFSWF